MNKICFIIMPISDIPEYPTGHFKRVYEHVIKPACIEAGFEPIRADDVEKTNNIALDIVQKVIESDMALCDLSAKNPNVLYELGIRQAFNKPVTLIKDFRTSRIFDISGFRDIEYDENLRIDNVEATISILSKTILNTYNEHSMNSNSLVSLLGIEPATIGSKTVITNDTKLILDSLNNIYDRISSLEAQKEQIIVPQNLYLPNKQTDSFFSNDIEDYNVGDIVHHSKFGYGSIISIEKTQKEPIIKINFEGSGEKKLMIRYARLKKVIGINSEESEM